MKIADITKDTIFYQFNLSENRVDSEVVLDEFRLKGDQSESQIQLENQRTKKFEIVWQAKLEKEFSETPIEAAEKYDKLITQSIELHEKYRIFMYKEAIKQAYIISGKPKEIEKELSKELTNKIYDLY
jgi:plasmid maintenance system killer protein